MRARATTSSASQLAGCAKNAAALAAGARAPDGANAAGAAAGPHLRGVPRARRTLGARDASFTGLAGAGDLVATVLAAHSRNRRAGELLAQGVEPARDRRDARPGRRGARPRARCSPRRCARRASSAPATAELAAARSRAAIGADQLGRAARAVRAPGRGRPERRRPDGAPRSTLSVDGGSRPPADKAALDREFSDFYREHLRDIYNYTYYRTGNHHDAEDLTTQTFIQAYRHFERAQRESNGRPLRPWLIRIAHNLAANYYRDRSRKPTSVLEDAEVIAGAARHRAAGRGQGRGGRGARGRQVAARRPA